MSFADIKLWGLNLGAFAVTLTDIDLLLKIALLLVTLGYTIDKWLLLRKNKD